MKLTKGKISKIYQKKRQSLKKKNIKKKKSSQRNTFRKKRGVNLAKRSLKRYKGGVVDTPEPKSEVTEHNVAELPELSPSAEEHEAIVAPAEPESHPPENTIPNVEPQMKSPVITQAEPLSEEPSVSAMASPSIEPSKEESDIQSEPPVIPEQENATEESPANVEKQPVSEENGIDSQPLAEPTSLQSEPTSLESEPSSLQSEPSSLEQPHIEDMPEEPSTNLQSSMAAEEQPLEQNPVGSSDELTSAINTVVDVISDKIADKISQTMSEPTNASGQNGFQSVNNGALTMATNGGSNKRKFNKTRKFKLLKNNKTRHIREILSNDM